MAANPRIDDWTGRRVWLVGASAGIGAALARALAARGALLTLTARNAEGLAELAAQCGPETRLLAGDVTDVATLDRWFAGFDQHDKKTPGDRSHEPDAPLPELGIYLAGDYTPLDASDGEAVLPAARRMLAVNYSAAVEWALRLAPRQLAQLRDQLHHRPSGRPQGIALVASVAGYAGLPKALAYSPSKAALIRFAECLHLDLARHGLGVWSINPGFVATRLTAQNAFTMPALITAERAAQEIIAGFATGSFEIHFPKRFTRAMKLLAALPYALSIPLLRRLSGKT